MASTLKRLMSHPGPGGKQFILPFAIPDVKKLLYSVRN